MDNIFLILVFIFFVDPNGAIRKREKMCPTSVISRESNPCGTGFNKTVCLVCPIPNTERCSTWWLENTQVARFNNCRTDCNPSTQHRYHEFECHPTNYSLRVINIYFTKMLNYTCRSCPKLSFSYGVTLTTQVNTALKIVKDNPLGDEEWGTQIGKMETFYCRIYGAISPFNLTWFIDDVENKTLFFEKESNELKNYNSSLSFVVPERRTTISCKIRGPYIVPNSANVSIGGVNTESETDDPPTRNGIVALYICVPCLFIVSIFTSFVLYFKAKHHRQLKLDERRKSRLDKDDSMNPETFVDSACPYSDISNEEHELTTEEVTPVPEAKISLVTKLKTVGSYEYWSATYINKSSIEEKCFAKTLSNTATMKDATTFQELASKLKSLAKSNFLVLVLSISIEELPYTICYQYMECGSLRDFMLKRYQQTRKSRMLMTSGKKGILPANVKSQIQELLTFASMIAEALKFVNSQKFSHPALSLKKVLLSEYCECKLYDIYPAEMAMVKVNELMKKQHPPIAWMAPETVFLNEYLPESDVWSFAVLLWELFSLGEVPLATLNKTEVEQTLRDGFVLTQPLSCPGAMYGIMLSCWNNTARKRPSLEHLLEKTMNMMEKYDKEEKRLPSIHEYPKDSYFVLDPNGTDNYI